MDSSTFLGKDSIPPTPPSSEEKALALVSHLITFLSTFIGPLVILLVKNDSSFVSHHARESLNFQITMLIITILLFISLIGIILLWVVGIYAVIMVIIATIKASEGKEYKYPLTLRLIK